MERFPIRFMKLRPQDLQKTEGFGPDPEHPPKWLLSGDELHHVAGELLTGFTGVLDGIDFDKARPVGLPYYYEAKVKQHRTCKTNRKDIEQIFEAGDNARVIGLDGKDALVVKIIERVYNPSENAPANKDDEADQHVNQGQLELAEFKELWTRINAKTAYTVHFDEKQLCDKCITTLNQKLTVPNVVITVTTGELKEDMSKDELAHGDAARETNVASHTVDATVGSGYRCDLLGRIAELTGLKRETIAAILSGMHPQVFQLFRKNPESFIFNSAKLIKGEVAAAIIEHITYDKIDDSYKMSIFTDPENLRHAYGDSFKYGPSEKGVYDLQVLDSDVEVKFAAELEHRQEVVVYTKLPKVFAISTPVGDYNPDWAIVTDALGKRHVYFVAETKGSLDSLDLRGIEDAKIACARKHFAAISGANITYDVVRTYQDLLDIVTGKI